MFKKVISGILSLAMCSSLAVSLKTSNETTNSNNTQNKNKSDYELSGSNSLGNYLTKLSNQNPQEPAVKTETSLFSVTALEFDAETGDVHICSTQTKDCNVTVAIADEFTGEIVKTAVFPVESGEFVVTDETIDTSSLPKYFIVKAFLSDKIGGKISNEYVFTKYTKDMQEILEADIHDFNEEQVINFDENEDTNFIVLSDDTVISESTEGENVLVTADYDSNVFSFENADENIRSMEFGQYLYIQPNETDIIAVAVDSVETDGDITTVKGSDEPIDDMFDFIKIEQNELGSTMTVDTTNMDESLTYVGHEDESEFTLSGESSLQFAPYMASRISAPDINDINGNSKTSEFKIEKEVKINLGESSLDDLTEEDKAFALEGDVKVKFELNFYKKFSHTNISFSVTPSVSASISVTLGKDGSKSIYEIDDPLGISDRMIEAHNIKPDELPIPLGHILITTGVPGILIDTDPKFVITASAKLSVTFEMKHTYGFTFDNENSPMYEFIHDDSKDLAKLDILIEGDVTVKLVFDPKITFLNEKVAYCGVEAGLGVSLSMEISKFKNEVEGKKDPVIKLNSDAESVHGCLWCYEGEAKPVMELNVIASILGHSYEATNPIEFPDVTLTAFHISNHCKLKLGPCDYKKYRAQFNVTDQDGNALSGCKVTLNGVSATTDESGKTAFFCDNSEKNSSGYSCTIEYGDKLINKTIKIDNAPQTINTSITIKKDSKGNNKISINANSKSGAKVTTTTNVLNTTKWTAITLPVKQEYKKLKGGQLGEHISYVLYGDGTMIISGYGDMDDKLTSSALNGSYDIDHDGITEKNGFRQVVKEVIFAPQVLYSSDPDTGADTTPTVAESDIKITSIGNGLFSVCPNLTKIELPSTITVIGDSAFDGCTGIKEANLPSIVSIGHQAFDHCTSLETVNLSDCLEFIYAGAFAGSRITSVIIPESIKVIGVEAFGGALYGYCKNLKSVTINGDYISENGKPAENTFSGIESLETVKFGDKVTIINANEFSNCPKLTEIKLPENLEKIGTSAFHNTQLKNVTIPASVKEIGSSAFSWFDKDKNTSMSDITILNPDVKLSPAAGGTIHAHANITIHGYVGSTAEKLADKNGSNRNIFVAIDDTATTNTTSKATQTTKATTTTTAKPADILYGDANCNGKVDISDAVLIMQSLSNPSKYGPAGSDPTHITKAGQLNADVNETGNGVTNKDALSIQRYALQLIDKLPE